MSTELARRLRKDVMNGTAPGNTDAPTPYSPTYKQPESLPQIAGIEIVEAIYRNSGTVFQADTDPASGSIVIPPPTNPTETLKHVLDAAIAGNH